MIIATFAVLSLLIGIIVSTMQELATRPETDEGAPESTGQILRRLEPDLKALLAQMPAPKTRD